MASPSASIAQIDDSMFLGLPCEIRSMIYRHLFPTKDDNLHSILDHGYLNIMYANRLIKEEAAEFFYPEVTFPIFVQMEKGSFFHQDFYKDNDLHLAQFQNIHKSRINIDWDYKLCTRCVSRGETVAKAVSRMQRIVEVVTFALNQSDCLKSIEIVCFSKIWNTNGDAPKGHLPGPLSTLDLFRAFEQLHERRPGVKIFVTDVENLTGRGRQAADPGRLSLKATVEKLSHQLRREHGPSHRVGLRSQ